MITRLLLFATAAMLASPVSAADSSAQTAKLIGVLNSDAQLFEKARACQQLGEIGSADAVPALAAQLTDPHVSAYARSGLENIPAPKAAAALREAAAKLNGPLLAGVVNSLAAVRDEKAVELLTKLADDPASGVVSEALLALGNIASPHAIRVLERKLARGPDDVRPKTTAACLLAADRQRTTGNLRQAASLYDSIREAKVPMVYRAAATRGAILARGSKRVPFLIEQLRSGDLAIRNAALLTIREIPDEKLAAALNTELGRAAPELQGQILLALVDCHNEQSVAAIEPLTRSSNPETRKTALAVLGRLGSPAAPALLAALQKESAAGDRTVILDGLRAIPGAAVDDLLLQGLRSTPTSQTRVDLIRLLESRGATKANGEILKLAGGQEKEVSLAALSALKSLAGPGELPELIGFIKTCRDEELREAAETAIIGACERSPAQKPGAEVVLNELTQVTKPADRNSWVRILAAVGYTKALPVIEAAAADPDQAVASNALAQLGRWPDPTPMDTLLKAMDSAPSPALRKRALTSVIDLAATATDEGQRPDATTVGWLRRADSAAQSVSDKRRILGILGRLKTVDSFRLLASHLENADLRTEAASGVVQIAPALAKGPEAGALKAALEKIAATVANADLRDRAAKVARTIPAQPAAVSLFDGRSLAGWEGDTKVWRVSDGAIVGGSMQGNPRNEFLATARSYTNFILRLEYKLVGSEGFVNSGVQIRSVRVTNPPNEMSGYQADIGAGYSGCLYDESRRNKFLVQCGEELIKRLEKPGEWNRYEVRTEGPRIQLWLNGERTVDYTETDAAIPQHGLIALQIHGGNKAEVSFRNITLDEL